MSTVVIHLSILALASASTMVFTVPSEPTPGSETLDAAPVALSYEFFQFPSYFTNVSHTWGCSAQLQRLTGVWPRIRIGGTSEDRATYVPSLSEYVLYPGDENTFSGPSNFTFGPSFIELASKYPGTVVMGLNRGGDNISNTIDAAIAVVNGMGNLYAIELGNEPDIYPYTGFAIAPNPATWTPVVEAASEASWQIAVGSSFTFRQKRIIQAGNFYGSPVNFSAAELIQNENSTAFPYIKDFSHHNYPQSTYFIVDLPSLMSHRDIVNNVRTFEEDVAIARRMGWEYVFGETNSVSGGGSNLTSPCFGSAIWLLDYALRSASVGIKRNYFHQCTIGICYYSWWDRGNVNAPFYGAYVATAAMSGGAYISALDDGTSNYGGYVVYDASRRPVKIVLINSDYYTGNVSRPSSDFVLTGLEGKEVIARRFTAESALARVDEGRLPAFGGQYFVNENCAIAGHKIIEATKVVDGTASFNLAASEALLIELCV
ncbi:glycoside hydrolase family 79 protein [Oidiodendron maius Zn]|uniref:Glycoside hydrolase family 79 protein n=1 Tax=Oidiodendron maius (strain Zn) TaxID=913774 RepID=A0A0C3CSQ6_OIDMZ|nr:glycoside hydrolase family 79 protein [Oidiodendron maius Zn]